MFRAHAIAILLALFTLTACSDSDEVYAPGPAVTVSGSPGQLDFRWQPVDGATHYRIEKRNGELLAFGVISPDITGTSWSLPVRPAQVDWENSGFRLVACKASRCVPSTAIGAQDAMTGTIGMLHAPLADAGAAFGIRLALSADGSTLAVARAADATDNVANDCDDAATHCLPDAGAVDVFRAAGSVWTLETTLYAPLPAEADFFGVALAISSDGSTLAIGASGDDSAATGVTAGAPAAPDNCNGVAPPSPCAGESGAVYVFDRGISGWALSATLKAGDTNADDELGSRVALSADGSRLAAAAPRRTAGGIDDAGSVYVFDRSGGQWQQQRLIEPPDNSRLLAGRELTLSGDGLRLAIASVDAGAIGTHVDVVRLEAGGLSVLEETLDNTDGNTAVPLLNADGSQIVTGYPSANYAEVGRRTGNSWAPAQRLDPPEAVGHIAFGDSIATSSDGRTIAVGAPVEGSFASGVSTRRDDMLFSCDAVNHRDCALGAGAVFVFRKDGSDWRFSRYVKSPVTEAFFHNSRVNPPALFEAPSADLFGRHVSLSGDGSLLAVAAVLDDGAATGTTQDATDDCETAVPFRCVPDAGALYLY